MFRGLGVVLLRGGLFSRRQPGRKHSLEGLLLDAHMFQLSGEEVLLVQDAGDAAVLLPPDAAAAEVNCTGCYECGQSDRTIISLYISVSFFTKVRKGARNGLAFCPDFLSFCHYPPLPALPGTKKARIAPCFGLFRQVVVTPVGTPPFCGIPRD